MYRNPRIEKKYVDLAAANYNCDTTGTVTLIPVIAQGAGESQRIGRQVTLRSLECRGFFLNNSTAITNDVRMMIVWDKQPNKALAAVTDILNSASVNSFNNDQNKRRFKVLKNCDEVLCGNSLTAGQNNDSTCKDADFYIKLGNGKRKKGLISEFGTAGTGAIGDITTGALLLVTVGSTAAGTAACTLTAGFRVRYTDE